VKLGKDMKQKERGKTKRK